MTGRKKDQPLNVIVCARVTDLEHINYQQFAADRKIGITAAVRMLLAIGFETMNKRRSCNG